MTTQHMPALEGSPRPGRSLMIALTGITAAVAIALGVRAWQATAAPEGQAIPHAVISAADEDARLPAAPSGGAKVRSVLYVVDSEESAAFVQGFSNEMNVIRVQSGQQPVEVGVVVLNGADASVLEGLPRTPDTMLYDLRMP